MNPDDKIRVLVLDIPEPRRDELRALLRRELPNVELVTTPHLELKDMDEKIETPRVLTTDMIEAATARIADSHTFVNLEPKPAALAEARRLGLVPVPTKSKTLRTLRKVFPGARFQSVTVKGKQSIQLFYKPRKHGDEAPINSVEIPENGTEAGACQALLCAAFRVYGMAATWDPKFPGAYRLSPIKDHKGVEERLPIELDPAEPVNVEALGEALADRANGKTTAEESNAAIMEAITPKPEAQIEGGPSDEWVAEK